MQKRKMGTAVATITMAVAGLMVPAATAQADTGSAQGPNCNAKWPGRNGNMYAWRDLDCSGELLGFTPGNDSNWADGSGAFRGSDNDSASSVMNAGTLGGLDVVAFYRNINFAHQDGGGCLSPHELYADDLRDNFHYPVGGSMDNSISSHRWVTAGDCHPDAWIT